MDKYCKGCKYHYNAGHPQNSKLIKYNDFCGKFSRVAPKAIGECKLRNGRMI